MADSTAPAIGPVLFVTRAIVGAFDDSPYEK
jgi:hypothetical protein